ncbi:hypothetical protein D3C78_1656600 [compost metagenome]
MVEGVGRGQHRADVGFFQFVEAQCGADARRIVDRLLGHAQVTDFDFFLWADDAGAFDHVAQFADVARPAIA